MAWGATGLAASPCSSHASVPLCVAGFEACLNARADKPAELIARYLDSVLRRGSKAGALEGSLEEVLDAALVLFRYVQVGPGCCCCADGLASRRPLPCLVTLPTDPLSMAAGQGRVRGVLQACPVAAAAHGAQRKHGRGEALHLQDQGGVWAAVHQPARGHA